MMSGSQEAQTLGYAEMEISPARRPLISIRHLIDTLLLPQKFSEFRGYNRSPSHRQFYAFPAAVKQHKIQFFLQRCYQLTDP